MSYRQQHLRNKPLPHSLQARKKEFDAAAVVSSVLVVKKKTNLQQHTTTTAHNNSSVLTSTPEGVRLGSGAQRDAPPCFGQPPGLAQAPSAPLSPMPSTGSSAWPSIDKIQAEARNPEIEELTPIQRQEEARPEEDPVEVIQPMAVREFHHLHHRKRLPRTQEELVYLQEILVYRLSLAPTCATT